MSWWYPDFLQKTPGALCPCPLHPAAIPREPLICQGQEICSTLLLSFFWVIFWQEDRWRSTCKWRAHFHITQAPTTPHLHQSPACLVHWSQNCLCLSKTPVLIHPDTAKPFIIEVVASDSGVRVVLCSQRSGLIGKLQLCAFFCHLLQRKITVWCGQLGDVSSEVGSREMERGGWTSF